VQLDLQTVALELFEAGPCMRTMESDFWSLFSDYLFCQFREGR